MDKIDKKEAGRRFQSLRIRKGFERQVDMIKDFESKTDIKLSKSKLSNYESGLRFPENDMLNALADYFNVTLDYLHCRSREHVRTVKDTVNNIYTMMDQLSENDQEDILKYIQFKLFQKGK